MHTPLCDSVLCNDATIGSSSASTSSFFPGNKNKVHFSLSLSLSQTEKKLCISAPTSCCVVSFSTKRSSSPFEKEKKIGSFLISWLECALVSVSFHPRRPFSIDSFSRNTFLVLWMRTTMIHTPLGFVLPDWPILSVQVATLKKISKGIFFFFSSFYLLLMMPKVLLLLSLSSASMNTR